VTRFACIAALCAAATAVPSGADAAAGHVRHEEMVPMRDGAALAADVYLPDTSGRWPAVLVQTPYDKQRYRGVIGAGDGEPFFDDPAYAFVVIDWRGFFASSAAPPSGYDSGLDGYDAVEWIAAQPWSDGRVATWGPSALGIIQFRTAATRPPHLAACVPQVAHMRDEYELYYPGGIYARNKNTFVAVYFGAGPVLRAHPLEDEFWAVAETAGVRPEQIDVPMLHVSGWYDHETDLSLRAMAEIAERGGPHARGAQWALIGPWAHGGVDAVQQGTLAFPDAAGEAARETVAFLDHVLRGVDNGWERRQRFRYFPVNDTTWTAGTQWPPSNARVTPWYLGGNGQLLARPAADAPPLRWTSDPAHPVPTVHGAVLLQTPNASQGPGDLAPLLDRDDVILFATPAVSAPLRIAGRPAATLWLATDAVDVDAMVRLVDVEPGGRVELLVDAARRVSLRDTFAARSLLSGGETVAVTVELPSIAATIPAGHRLGVLIAASNFDRFDRNMQDGSSFSDEKGASATPAQIELHLDAALPSRIELPVVAAPRPPRRRLGSEH